MSRQSCSNSFVHRAAPVPTSARKPLRAGRLSATILLSVLGAGQAEGANDPVERVSAPEARVDAAEDQGLTFQLGADFGRIKTDRIGSTGLFKRQDAVESSLTHTPDEIDVSGYSLGLSYNTGKSAFWDFTGRSRNLTYFVDWQSLSGDETASGTLAPGTDDVAFLYQGLVNGQYTGILFGDQVGLQSRSRIEYDENVFKVGMRWRCLRDVKFQLRFDPQVYLKYASRDWDFSTTDFTQQFPDIRADKGISVEENNLYLGLGTRVSYPLTSKALLFLYGGIDVGRVDADMKFSQIAYCPPCTLPELRNVQFNYDDSESKTVVDPSLTLGLSYNITPRLNIGLSAGVENRHQATIDDAATGQEVLDGGRTKIRIRQFTTRTLRLGVKYTF
jgi:opacity protein-like surface antigen